MPFAHAKLVALCGRGPHDGTKTPTMATIRRQSLFNEKVGAFVDEKHPRTHGRFRNLLSCLIVCCFVWVVSALICGLAVHQSEKDFEHGAHRVYTVRSDGNGGKFSLRKAGLALHQSIVDNGVKQCTFYCAN